MGNCTPSIRSQCQHSPANLGTVSTLLEQTASLPEELMYSPSSDGRGFALNSRTIRQLLQTVLVQQNPLGQGQLLVSCVASCILPVGNPDNIYLSRFASDVSAAVSTEFLFKMRGHTFSLPCPNQEVNPAIDAVATRPEFKNETV